MSRLVTVLAVLLTLAGCKSRKDEVVVAAPAAPPSPAQGAAMAPAQPGPVQGNEQLPPGHPSLDGAAPGGAMPEGAAPGQDGGMAMQNAPPHGAAMSAGDEVVVKVPKATGKDARTVAEIFAERQALKDKTVTVRGKVVRFTPGVMGKNWIHLRDGTGTQGKDNDVTVTTQDPAAKGDVVVIQGKVAVDQNIGMGSAYPVIIQDAKVSK